MKSSLARPPRGRPGPSKVTKPATPARARPGRQAAAQLAAHDALASHAQHQHQQHQQHQQHLVHEDHDIKQHDPNQDPSLYDDPTGRMGAEAYAAAAAAAVMDADMTADGHAEDEEEAEADMEDDDPTAGAQGLATHVDLTTAANILANGGIGGPSSQHGVDDQHHDLQQGLGHGHPHQQPQAQMGIPHLQQGGQQSSMDPQLIKTTQQLAQESGYDGLNIESALAKRLAREPGHRHAQQRRPEQVLNLGRRSNVEALFAHIAGEPARVPCKNCHKGHGPWAVQQHPSIMPASSSSLPADTSYRFATPHSLMGPAPGPPLGGMPHAGLLTSNPLLQGMVNRAMGEVRAADKAQRQLILIDITAKQLALQIAEYEEMTSHQEVPGQSVMGDDSAA
ncbi:hypothetical protein B0H67DRAFT_646408 [Lasiosphaeris hirsuta]|uniref:Uncharacterized protein n=1 Tax=Lasiosphaeris hirsuta TaxID=260670 RepID=A0AA40A8A3_9PEZI|nr:hypothetical protein B0H67DRAFT_646408 [Lasiosphaeris hirsuta]